MKIPHQKLLLVIVALSVLLGLNLIINNTHSTIEKPLNVIKAKKDSIDVISFKELHNKLDTIEKRIKRN